MNIISTLIKTIVFNINHELVKPSTQNGLKITYNLKDLFPIDDGIDIDEDSNEKCCNIM